MYVSVLVVRGLLAELEKRGHDSLAWLRDAEVDRGRLADLRAFVDVDTWDRLLKRAMHLLGDPALGLTIGFGNSEGMLQLLEYMLLSSRTLQEAFDLSRCYSGLIVDDMRLELLHMGARVHLRFGFHELASPESHRFGEELTAALAIRIGRHHVANGPKPEVRFRQPRPSYVERIQEAFRCPIRFGSSHSEIIFARSLLLQSQPHGDGIVVESLATFADRVLSEGRPLPTLTERVRIVLTHEPDLGVITTADLAAKLALTERTLRRRLHAEGSHLRALVTEQRMRAAVQILLTSTMTIKEVAERLGYSEPSAFHRAFKRWTGKTPSEFLEARKRELGSGRQREYPA